MLMAHAYAWHRNLTYHAPASLPITLRPTLMSSKSYSSNRFETILKFARPDTKRGGSYRCAKAYYRKDTAIWTAEWRNYIRSRLKPTFVKAKTTRRQ
jgi:hypothetical protein